MELQEIKKKLQEVEKYNPDLIGSIRGMFENLTKEQLVDQLAFCFISGIKFPVEDFINRSQPKTYKEIAKKLFNKPNTTFYYTTESGFTGKVVINQCMDESIPRIYRLNNCTSEKQAEKLMAINQLMNVAKYLNGDWKPDWNNEDEAKWSIRMARKTITIYYLNICNETFVYFKTQELAKQAVEILGNETIELALSTDW